MSEAGGTSKAPGATREPALRVMLLPRDTNGAGTIFGGVILSHIDLAGAVEARRHGPHRYVTVAMREVVFREPVYVGDLVSFYTETIKLGRTSVTVRVRVEAERANVWPPDPVHVTDAEAVYVAIGAEGRPVPLAGG